MPFDADTWQPRPRPGLIPLRGQYVSVMPYIDDVHADGLFAALCGEGDDDIWTYLPVQKPSSAGDIRALLNKAMGSQGWQVMVICDADSGEVLGMASYMRHRPEHGSVEVGCISFSKKLQRTRMATEAMYLMAKHALGTLGYRRYEWKCHNGNEASKRAAERYGFAFEGVFRNDRISKGESRDTAWYSIIDTEWPDLKEAFEAWLSPDNFDDNRKQKASLRVIRGAQA